MPAVEAVLAYEVWVVQECGEGVVPPETEDGASSEGTFGVAALLRFPTE